MAIERLSFDSLFLSFDAEVRARGEIRFLPGPPEHGLPHGWFRVRKRLWRDGIMSKRVEASVDLPHTSHAQRGGDFKQT